MELKRRIFRASRYVDTFSVLKELGIDIPDADSSYQIKCPFHGADNKPSARYYAAAESDPAHFYCFKCRIRMIGPELKAKQRRESVETIVREIELRYNLPLEEISEDSQELDISKFIFYCERKIRRLRSSMSLEDFLECVDTLDDAYKQNTLEAFKRASDFMDRMKNVDFICSET